MKLEIGKFFVKKIEFGSKTGYANGVLTINKEEALAKVKEEEHITEVELHIVNPGDTRPVPLTMGEIHPHMPRREMFLHARIVRAAIMLKRFKKFCANWR